MGAVTQLYQTFGKKFSKGAILFREGDEGTEMFVLRTGKVAISKTAHGLEKVLSTLGPGEFFGEMSIITGKPRTATATVVEDAQILVFDQKTFEAMIRGSPEIAVRMVKTLAARLAEADAQIENLLLQDASSRLVHFLSHGAATRGRPDPAGVRVDMPVADLPAELGLMPQALKEAMQKVVRAGLAKFDVDGFVVTDAARLQQFEEFLAAKAKQA